MLTTLWLKGITRRRSGRLAAAALGVALTVALLTALGSFIAGASATMTGRAIQQVATDWQVQLAPGTDPAAAAAALAQTTKYEAALPVGYADVAGFVATTGGTTQQTGAGKVLGLPDTYRRQFPQQLRPLLGSDQGVLVMQQTAANLHVAVGDTVAIQRVGQPDVQVKVAGIVELPNADSLFQIVGQPAKTAPQAPPDNVLLLPMSEWQPLFAAQQAARPDSVRTQLHVRISHDLPSDPTAAYTYVQQLANNLEARLVGVGIVGDNLAARLGGVRQDSLYARVLFLFLGLPGAVLAAVLTLAVAATGAARRRREQALLRLRGASTSRILGLASIEAVLLASLGLALGLALAWLAGLLVGTNAGLFEATTWLWTLLAAFIGLLLAGAAILLPAWRTARQATVVQARQAVGSERPPLYQRLGLDFVLLGVAGLIYWQAASSGYHLVLATEGVAQTAVDYTAFLAPFCLWLGGGLLTMRFARLLLLRSKLLTRLLRPVAHNLSGVVAAASSRQRGLLVRGLVLVALATSFAVSTAVFNTTYNVQAQVDAELTNGADVAVTGTAAAPAGRLLAKLAATQGVAAAQPLMHRFAYVGTDLQDMFGVDASHIQQSTTIANAYFGSGNAAATLAALAAQPDGVLVAAETVKDFQLQVGDQINLRLQSAKDQQYHIVPFHFLGVVREFPTAPKDSFLVANASYLAAQTSNPAAEVVLLRAKGDAPTLAAAVRPLVADLPGVRVTDLEAAAQTISSSLTAVDLKGLTLLELSFAVLLLVGASGLVLALSLAERRRSFAILSALGAKQGQIAAFFWSEGLLLNIGGGMTGVLLGLGLAQMLVKVLTGVFDPAPEGLSLPLGYLLVLVMAIAAATIGVVVLMRSLARQQVAEVLRDI